MAIMAQPNRLIIIICMLDCIKSTTTEVVVRYRSEGSYVIRRCIDSIFWIFSLQIPIQIVR